MEDSGRKRAGPPHGRSVELAKEGTESELDRIVDAADSNRGAARIDGIVIGRLIGFGDHGGAMVWFPELPDSESLLAKSVCALDPSAVGREVALMFENGDPTCPIAMGLIENPSGAGRLQPESVQQDASAPEIRGDRLVFEGDREIVLRCGKSSITLTRAGKILLRGAYLLSRSSGVNRIKGGSIQLN